MKLSFETRRFERVCNSDRELVRKFGPERGKILRRRLDQLRAAETLEVMRKLPGRCHELTADRQGTLSLDLDGPHRLIFKPADDPPPTHPDGGLAWALVTVVVILGVEDTHV